MTWGGAPEILEANGSRCRSAARAGAPTRSRFADRGGKSRFGLPPTEADVARAREALEDRRRKQELARRTRAARQDPAVRAAIAAAIARFGLADPEGPLLTAIARYSLDHVLAGISTYAAKFTARTLPPDADARYLLGIVRNIADEDEGWQMAIALLRARLAERDRALQRLQDEADRLAEDQEPEELVKRFVDRALPPRVAETACSCSPRSRTC